MEPLHQRVHQSHSNQHRPQQSDANPFQRTRFMPSQISTYQPRAFRRKNDLQPEPHLQNRRRSPFRPAQNPEPQQKNRKKCQEHVEGHRLRDRLGARINSISRSPHIRQRLRDSAPSHAPSLTVEISSKSPARLAVYALHPSPLLYFPLPLTMRRFEDHRECARLRQMLTVLIILQAFQVAFLWLHDWVPLGRLNDVPAVRAAAPTSRLIRVTLIGAVPFTIGLVFSIIHLRTGFPGWLWYWLWTSYALLFAGAIRAWWVPYLVRPDPVRASRYQAMFGGTHAFLPKRNGITPNTLHVALHACIAATLVVLAVLTA